MAYSTDPIVGVNLAENSSTPSFGVGTQVYASNGRYEYVQAAADVAQYAAVVINSSGQASEATTTLGATIKKIGFAQVALTSAFYGWVAREGDNIRCKLAVNCAAGAQLYTTGTAGVLDDAIVSQGCVHGTVCLGSISTATNSTILAASPHIGYGSAN